MSNTPTDEELIAELEAAGVAFMAFRGGAGLTREIWTTYGSQDAKKIATGIRAVLAKWGTPQPVVREPLTQERIEEICADLRNTVGCSNTTIARAIEAEVHKQYTELIRQMLDALENHDGNYKLSKSAGAVVDAAINAGRARLGEKT